MDLNGGGPLNDDNMAVILRNASKSYNKGNTRILDNMNMCIPRGCMYGLLGASGCGKTSLINVLVGLLKLDAGEVKVLGGHPGQKNSGVPGPRVGYMPQDSALVDEFTVRGAIFYFGWLYGMKSEEIQKRYDFLSELLELPPSYRMVNSLSGGQLRRISFAAAVVHSPELLILDEPTVGLDPILRESLWQYMTNISNTQNITILFTTHYIEEAKEADTIALLRHGKILAQTSPKNLLQQFHTDSLEEVFLILSKQQSDSLPVDDADHEYPGPSKVTSVTYNVTDESLNLNDFVVKPNKGTPNNLKSSFMMRMKALMYKNILKTFRNIPGMVFYFTYPLLFLISFFLAIGRDPTLLPIGIVNEELGNCYNLPGGYKHHSSVELLHDDEQCLFKGMSCLYISRLEEGTTINKYYDTIEEAVQATKNGKTHSTLYFHKNFTQAMQLRHDDAFSSDNTTVDHGEIRIWMDMSDYTIGYSLKIHFLDQFKDLLQYIARQCNLTESYSALPMKFDDPIYGKTDDTFTSFVAPGMLLSLMFYLSMMLTTTLIIKERSEGVWNRNLVAGVTETEIVVSQLLAQIITVAIQMVETIFFGYYVFDMQIVGNVFAMMVIMFLQAIVGAAAGLLISITVDNLALAFYASMGSYFPYILLSGIMWPIEGMYTWLQPISYYTPGTWAITSLRSIMIKGSELGHKDVYPGALVSTAWIVLLSGLCVFGLAMTKR